MDDDLRVDMRRLSPPQQEALRKRVMAAIRNGMADAEAVRVFGVSANSVRNWKARLEESGTTGLDSGRPGPRIGEHTKLSAAQTRALVGAVTDHQPDELGLDGKLWNRRKVRALAEQLFGVTFTDQGMGKLLRHPRFHLHFIPTSSSWLNLVERWFAEITAKLIRRSSLKLLQFGRHL